MFWSPHSSSRDAAHKSFLKSFVWTPLTNVYGRRPVTIVSQVFAILGNVGSANSKTYSALLGTRALNGIGMAGMMSVGTACLNDMFFLHERGEKTGIYTIFVTNGGHIAFLGQSWLSLNVIRSGLMTVGAQAEALSLKPLDGSGTSGCRRSLQPPHWLVRFSSFQKPSFLGTPRFWRSGRTSEAIGRCYST